MKNVIPIKGFLVLFDFGASDIPGLFYTSEREAMEALKRNEDANFVVEIDTTPLHPPTEAE